MGDLDGLDSGWNGIDVEVDGSAGDRSLWCNYDYTTLRVLPFHRVRDRS